MTGVDLDSPDPVAEAQKAAHGLRRTGRMFLIVAILLGLGILYNGYRTYTLDRETKDTIRASQLESCERGNKSRVARVESLREDVKVLLQDLALVRSQAPFILGGPLADWTAARTDAIEDKRHAIQAELDSVLPYPVHPGSALVDCEAQYLHL